MDKIGLFFLKGIGRLPLWFLYAICPLLYFVFYKILGYRKTVVRENLKLSFPNKTNDELLNIEKNYYKFFFALMMESVYCERITKEELEKRMPLENPEVLQELINNKQSAVFVCGHHNNWEWMARSFGLYCGGFGVIAYKPQTNKVFDSYALKIRKRFGEAVIAQEQFLRYIVKHRSKIQFPYLIADQTPHFGTIEFITPFLNQKTAVFIGPEQIAKVLDTPLYYLKSRRLKRGYYSFRIVLVSDKAKEIEKYELTKQHLEMLEKNILEEPSNWLWSHRRWKYTRSNP